MLAELRWALRSTNLPGWHQFEIARNNVDDINYHFNQDLANVNKWLIANRLTLHQFKTKFMLISSGQRIATFRSDPCFNIDGIPLDKVSHAKSLGVHFTENLSWNIPIASCIGTLKRFRSFDPVATLHLIIYFLVKPYFNHCCNLGQLQQNLGG